ncbi:hypothetical protein BSLA_01f3178 [Burkholderia stabilis]|nr:hypothetical protein BSLA_01f3178 [Burkholderia stabilis]
MSSIGFCICNRDIYLKKRANRSRGADRYARDLIRLGFSVRP